MLGPEIDDECIFITKRECYTYFVFILYSSFFHRLTVYFQKSTVHISYEQRIKN